MIIDPTGCTPQEISRTRASILKQWSRPAAIIESPFKSGLNLVDGGAFVAPIRAGDMLHPAALALLGAAIEGARGPVFAYSDEDEIDSSCARRRPYFKSDWNPDLFLGQDYACRAVLASAGALMAAGGFSDAPPAVALY
ncbi:MAG: hypothetical protein ACREUQ_03500, partial [Burkholderiales bacterium]